MAAMRVKLAGKLSVSAARASIILPERGGPLSNSLLIRTTLGLHRLIARQHWLLHDLGQCIE